MIALVAAALAAPPEITAEEIEQALAVPVVAPEDAAWAASLEAYLRAEGAAPEEAPKLAAEFIAFERAIPWQTGAVTIADGAVALALGPDDRYAGPAEASAILEAWGNPPTETLGMWLPGGSHLFGPVSWVVVLTLSDEGWVDDADAASIDYDALLGEMQAAEKEAAVARRSAGLEGLELTGWAESPRYDAANRVLYWATLVRADGGAQTLNYDVRVLGRGGVLSLNALAGADDLASVKLGMERIRGLAAFQPGHRYTDYTPGVDPKAAYGLAALVAGGAVAAKAGAFKGLLAVLLASKKLLVGGAVAVVAMARGAWAAVTGGDRDAKR